MDESRREPNPDPKSADKPPARKDPEPRKPPAGDPPEKTREDILEEDRFQSTDN